MDEERVSLTLTREEAQATIYAVVDRQNKIKGWMERLKQLQQRDTAQDGHPLSTTVNGLSEYEKELATLEAVREALILCQQ